MTVNRISIHSLKLVYVICANKRIKYSKGRTPVVYIGTTRNGISRVAASAAHRSEDVLWLHGVDSFQVRIVTCRVRQRVRTWHKLERALLLEFRRRYGEVPYCNTVGKNITETNEFEFFARRRVKNILEDLEDAVAPERRVRG
jgi:hypothetical protein